MTDLPRLYLITDRRRISGPGLLAGLDEAFRAGVRLAALRERDLTAADLLAYAEQAVRLAAAHGARLLINDRIDVALLARASGVHLRASSVPVAGARLLVGARALIGASAHTPAEARAAGAAGADFVVFGPVFATPEKSPYRPPQGIDALRLAARASPVPLFAIGGVTPERAAACLAAGAHGVAAVRGVLGAASIRARVAEYARALEAGARRRRASGAPRRRAGGASR